MSSFSAWDEKQAGEIIDGLKAAEGATLPILHALQAAFGFISERAIDMVAEALNLSSAEVFGVVSFYHDFRRSQPGRHVLKLCRAEACQAVGADHLAAQIQTDLGIGWGETTGDGRLTLEPVFCLGLCACAPAAMIDGRPVGNLTADAVAGLLARTRS